MTRPTGNPRGRPPMDPIVKYNDEIKFWTMACDYAPNGAFKGCQKPFLTLNRAIDWRHRLHRCRAAMRALEGRGIHIWDSLIIPEPHKIGDYWMLVIKPRVGLDLSDITDLSGNPIPVAENPYAYAPENIPGVYDPTKPLIDC